VLSATRAAVKVWERVGLRRCATKDSSKPTRLGMLYQASLGSLRPRPNDFKTANASVLRDASDSARGECDGAHFTSSSSILLRCPLTFDSRSYATKAFEDDNNLVGMGIFLVDKGGRLDRKQFKDQLRVVLDNCGKKPKADGTTKAPTLLFSQRPDNLRAAKKAYRGYLGDGGEPFELMDRPAARKPRLFLLRVNKSRRAALGR
jgi:hypothetical protein